MKSLLICLLALIFFGGCYAGVVAWKQSTPQVIMQNNYFVIPVETDLFPKSASTIDPDYAVTLLTEAMRNHQYYIDNPELCNSDTGYPQWHERWVRIYQQIILLIKEECK